MPAYEGGKFPLSTFLRARARDHSEPRAWRPLPDTVGEWLRIQEWRSDCRSPDEFWSRRFRAANKYYLVCYPFEGRLAHQTLGMLLTRRLERARPAAAGFSPTNMRWRCGGLRVSVRGVDFAKLFDEDMLGDDLDAWLAEISL